MYPQKKSVRLQRVRAMTKKMQTCDGLHLVSIGHRHWKSGQSKANRIRNNK